MNRVFDITIIGAGIVGLATAYKISLKNPKLKIAIIEKEEEVAAHQTGHNSGVIHSGIYYKPGSLKAVNCSKGYQELLHFSKEYGIAHDVCGKVIVATRDWEKPILDRIYKREGYSRWDINIPELLETLAYPGFRKLAMMYWKTGMGELYRSYSKRAFVKAL